MEETNIMLSHNKPKKGMTLTKVVYHIWDFRIIWRQSITSEGEIVGIGTFRLKEKHHKGG